MSWLVAKAARLLVLMVVAVSGTRECSSDENMEMQAEFMECATKLSHAHFQATDSMGTATELEAATCKLFSGTIEDCGKSWERCHGEEDIRIMKQLYLRHLMSQIHLDVNRCEVVKEIRESGGLGRDDLCSNARLDELTRKFQECSHSTTSAAYQTVMDITDPTTIIDALCMSLTTTANVCGESLRECYDKETGDRIISDHLKELESFLLQVVDGKVKNDSLKNCPVYGS